MDRRERNALSAGAVIALRSLILDGEFPANTRLPETQLAERLGISRTPLRQAMDRLVDEGLLERLGTGGCRVARFTVSDALDSIELRGVLEGTAARMAAERGAAAGVMAEFHEVLGRLDTAAWSSPQVDLDVYVRENAQFHRLLARASGSSVIEREVDRAVRLPLASPSAFLQGQEFLPDFQASLRRAQRQHRHMVDAIRNREGSRAEALAREHARLARENLEFVLGGDPRLAARVPGLALVAHA
jgi:GntR family transcriptional regulator, vanillate catabolism transcriptional regulator